MDRASWHYPTGDLRVSDADRDRALAELTEAFQVGRLTAEEFDQRSGQALGARTGNDLTALLADLPADPAPATRAKALEGSRRVRATRITFAAGAAAICCAFSAAAAALSTGPSLQQREFLQATLASRGLPVPPALLRSPGFNWAGTLTPAAIAVLLIVLVICLRVHMARTDRA